MARSLELAASGFPIIQGIELVSTHQLPDRMRSVFKYPVFNAIQSKCFSTIFHTDDNFVLSAPTGSGKTTILELAICRLVAQSGPNRRFKVIYQAPTKALCSERQTDWALRFSHLGLSCAELTGDTDQKELRSVQSADVIITTPEKWDSMTRKWRDHAKLIELVKLFLIDEVHILKEDRGAILEAVVCRMKFMASNVRFLALSATVPNSNDIATWLGRNCRIQNQPAVREVFGDDFRPVRLQKHVIGLQHSSGNDWVFEQTCNKRLPEVIAEYGVAKKPIMIFCFTRKSSEETARLLAHVWSSSAPSSRQWASPTERVSVRNESLRKCISSGVAFHHAGLDLQDRIAVEKAYLSGGVNVICSTSTLAMGVNLPCHFVIIKNTVSYQAEGLKEYSDLEVIQMLGRAGRPQFDHSAVAVIMTRPEKVERYRSMVSGQQVLESRLHDNLIDHLNSEIGLGTIHDRKSARDWLASTFFFVRFQQNPQYYQLKGVKENATLEDIINDLCVKDLNLLQECSLITGDEHNFRSTELGDAMARYYIQFQTMKLFVSLPTKPRISEILSVIAQAKEYSSIRFRAKEKTMFKDINSSPSIKFPIKVDIALPGHKISLIIQTVLGGIDASHDDRFADNHMQFQSDCTLIFQHVHRLVRCIIDCQLYLADSVGVRNALELARSLGARAWDDSPLQLQQIEKIGPVSVRKLVAAGIRNMEELENSEPHRIDMILNKNPPFAATILERLKSFPKLRISLKLLGPHVVKCTSTVRCVRINVKADLGFLNEKTPAFFMNRAVHVILLAETSDGRKVHFQRSSAQKISNGQDVTFAVDLTSTEQIVNCYVSCDEIAGTLKHASLNPKVPASAFPANAFVAESHSVSRKPKLPRNDQPRRHVKEDFDDTDLDDLDFMAAGDEGFVDIDELATDDINRSKSRDRSRLGQLQSPTRHVNMQTSKAGERSQPERLRNGKWACNHKCKNKRTCKHTCCRDGLDKPPKAPKPASNEDDWVTDARGKHTQRKATEFFDQTIPTTHSGATTSKIVSQMRSNTGQVVRKRSPLRSKSGADDKSATLDDYRSWCLSGPEEIEAKPSAFRETSTVKASGTKQSSRLFLTDSSSPFKNEGITRVDLPGGQVGHKRHREYSDELDDQSDQFSNFPVTENLPKRRMVLGHRENLGHRQLCTLQDLEQATASVLPFSSGTEIAQNLTTGAANSTNNLSGSELNSSLFDDPTIFEMSGALLSNEVQHKEKLMEHATCGALCGDFDDGPLSMPGVPQASCHHEAGPFELDSTDEYVMQPHDAGFEPEQPKQTLPEGIEPWFLEQFGAYVEFI